MFRFLGFKASLNFGSSKNLSNIDYPVGTANTSAVGAYRPKREEFFGNGSLSETPKKITPSMVTLPQGTKNPLSANQQNVQLSKSTGNLVQPPQKMPPNNMPSLNIQPSNIPQPPPQPAANNTSLNIPVTLRKSSPNVSTDPRGGTPSVRDSTDIKKEPTKKEQKILNQKQKTIATNDRNARKLMEQEQNKQKKLAAQQEKQRKEREKAERKRQKELEKRNKKNKAPPLPSTPPPPPELLNRSVLPEIPVQGYSNTLESSISRSTGPPPYDETPESIIVRPNKRDNSGNTSFGKKIEEPSSWDLVSQHRQQMAAPVTAERRTKLTVMDLGFNGGDVRSGVDNSDA